LKVLHINTDDGGGGAGRAAHRLHKSLLAQGVDSQMLVYTRTGGDVDNVRQVFDVQPRQRTIRQKLARRLDSLPLRFVAQHPRDWSTGFAPNGIAQTINDLRPDILHLHWINYGYVPIGALPKIDAPLVWTFHDMWAMTGGCHVAGDCTRYRQHCEACPQLASRRKRDLSFYTHAHKIDKWRDLGLTIVTPSHWMRACVHSSALFSNYETHVIPNTLDLDFFAPFDRHTARDLLGLPRDQTLIMFGAGSVEVPHKGADLLRQALGHLAGQGGDLALVVVGATHADDWDVGLPVHPVGYVRDDLRLKLLYCAADCYVLPSRVDNLPNMVMEAMACGTPCIGFRIGGVPDLIDHEENGFIAPAFDVEALARGIQWVTADVRRQRILGEAARRKVATTFSPPQVATAHLDLYNKLFGTAGQGGVS